MLLAAIKQSVHSCLQGVLLFTFPLWKRKTPCQLGQEEDPFSPWERQW